MSTDIATAAEFHLTGWWDKNKQNVIKIAGVAAVVALVASFFVWKKGQREVEAGEALSSVQATAPSADAYLKVAGQYAGTAAGSRAVLLAAGQAFSEGKYADAQNHFERYLRDAGDSAWRSEALLGVAACLAAQGKSAEATTKYQDFLQRHGTEAGGLAARSALAHLYEKQNKLSEAVELYRELARTAQNSSYGLESMVRLQDLIAQHPELAQPKVTTAVAPALSAPAPAAPVAK